ncbi:MAG: hypothetical protein ACHQUC_04970 [Chlamydiales bacterium]
MALSTNFYIELPYDEHWNVLYLRQVIQAEEMPPDEAGTVFLKVLAPGSFQSRYKTVDKSRFTVCSGPARELSFKSYVDLMNSLRPDFYLE